MKNLHSLFTLVFALFAIPVAGQQGQEPPPGPEPGQPQQIPRERPREPDVTDRGHLHREWFRIASAGHSSHAPPGIVPQGWFDDYDYQSDLDKYLSEKYQGAMSAGKNTYIYLYADWYEVCKRFRKTFKGEDYAELFLSNAIIMLNAIFFEQEFDPQFIDLPVFIKINDNGILGPEVFYPTWPETEHPQRAYYKLKKFFQSDQEIP
jgi:hypothetical protein